MRKHIPWINDLLFFAFVGGQDDEFRPTSTALQFNTVHLLSIVSDHFCSTGFQISMIILISYYNLLIRVHSCLLGLAIGTMWLLPLLPIRSHMSRNSFTDVLWSWFEGLYCLNGAFVRHGFLGGVWRECAVFAGKFSGGTSGIDSMDGDSLNASIIVHVSGLSRWLGQGVGWVNTFKLTTNRLHNTEGFRSSINQICTFKLFMNK